MSEVRLIDANALKQDLRQYFTDGVLDGVSAKLAFNQILHDIDNAPTIEPFEKIGAICNENCGYNTQGEWLLLETDCDDGGNNRYECSECHYSDIHSESAEVPYCWHCGSKMKGGTE